MNPLLVIISNILCSNSTLSEVVTRVYLHNIHVNNVRLVPATTAILGGSELILFVRGRILIHRNRPFLDILRLGLFFPFDLNMNGRLMNTCLFLCFRVSNHRISTGLDFNIIKSTTFSQGFSVVNSVVAGVLVHVVAVGL